MLRPFVFFVSVTVLYAYPATTSRLVQFRPTPTDEEMRLEEDDIFPVRFQARNGLRSDTYRWENGIVYYEIDSVFGDKERILIRQAFDEVEHVTCVRFKPKSDDIKDYVYITGDNTGCNSHVGRISGKQKMNLKLNGCLYIGTIIHESLHSLGFKHEHMTSNRDKYVHIETENISSAYLYAFDKLSPTYVTDFGIPYDYNSIMHYGRKAFTKNGKDTIVPLVEGAKIGQRLGLSISDIRKINLMYSCPENQYLT